MVNLAPELLDVCKELEPHAGRGFPERVRFFLWRRRAGDFFDREGARCGVHPKGNVADGSDLFEALAEVAVPFRVVLDDDAALVGEDCNHVGDAFLGVLAEELLEGRRDGGAG